MKSLKTVVVQQSSKWSRQSVIDLDARHILAMSKICGLTAAVIGFAITMIWKL